MQTLPDTSERARQELALQLAFGNVLMATQGYGAPEVGQVYLQARELCQQVRETEQLFPVLFGLWLFYELQGKHQLGQELAEQCLSIARNVQNPAFLLEAYRALGVNCFH